MLTDLRSLTLGSLLVAASTSFAADTVSDGMQEGIALITSWSGEVKVEDGQSPPRSPELHHTGSLSGMRVETGREGQIFLSLSNGVGLSIGHETVLRIESFLQAPFTAARQSTTYEPSRSRLVIELTVGSLCFYSERLSPLSEILIQLPDGQIQINQSSGRVLYDSTGARITIGSGIVSFIDPESLEREFINGPETVWIRSERTLLKEGVSTVPAEQDPSRQLTDALMAATRYASERVLFRVTSEEASIPQPVLITPAESGQQLSPRPYRYLE